MTTADKWLRDLATDTADALSTRATTHGLGRVNERDHLQPCCSDVARTLAARWAPPPAVSTTIPLASSLWPRVGRFDVAFVVADEKPIAVELKCGTGRDAIAACVWDALKLAFAIQTDAISAGYLMAATTAVEWSGRTRGAELFDDGSFEAQGLREAFADWWKVWERDGYPAGTSVPRGFVTRALCRAPFMIGDEWWELRVAGVEVRTTDRVVWRPLLRDPAPVLRHPETLELLSWVSREPRSYPEAIEVWQTHCPRHSVWEDALGAGLIQVVRNGRESHVALTAVGEAVLERGAQASA